MDVLLHYSLDCKAGLGPRFSKRLACVESVCSRVIARKLEREQKKCHSFFLLFLSQPSRRTRAETLATQATKRPETFLARRQILKSKLVE